MILVDANVLLNAYHPRSSDHERCRAWLKQALEGDQPLALCWLVLQAFLRISTNPRIFTTPLQTAEAIEIISAWLARPNVVVLEAGPRHWPILQGVLVDAQITGPMVTDAALVALAIEHGAGVCTLDRGFRRFGGLRLIDPLAA